MYFNKKGEEFVEAAIVLPLIFLMILGIIGVLLHLYNVEKKQSDCHNKVIMDISREQHIFGVKSDENSVSTNIAGIAPMTLKNTKKVKAYILNPSKALRIGDFDKSIGSENFD